MSNTSRNPKRVYEPDSAAEIRIYSGKPYFCRSPQLENVFITRVVEAGEEYDGNGRSIPRSVWSKCPLATKG